MNVVQISFARDSNEWNAGVDIVYILARSHDLISGEWSIPYKHSFVVVAIHLGVGGQFGMIVLLYG